VSAIKGQAHLVHAAPGATALELLPHHPEVAGEREEETAGKAVTVDCGDRYERKREQAEDDGVVDDCERGRPGAQQESARTITR
jgi:hypothetical protein